MCLVHQITQQQDKCVICQNLFSRHLRFALQKPAWWGYQHTSFPICPSLQFSMSPTKKCQQHLGDERKISLCILDVPESTSQSLAYLLLLAVTTAPPRQLLGKRQKIWLDSPHKIAGLYLLAVEVTDRKYLIRASNLLRDKDSLLGLDPAEGFSGRRGSHLLSLPHFSVLQERGHKNSFGCLQKPFEHHWEPMAGMTQDYVKKRENISQGTDVNQIPLENSSCGLRPVCLVHKDCMAQLDEADCPRLSHMFLHSFS